MRWLTLIGAGAALYYLAGRSRRQPRGQGRAPHMPAGQATAGMRTGFNADDERLAARVHSALGHVTRHAHDIEVHADDGRITLSGTVWRSEEADILLCAGQIEGVQEVRNQMQAVGLPDDVALPGEQPPHMLVPPHDHPSPPGQARDKP
jgi:hypothetical protein